MKRTAAVLAIVLVAAATGVASAEDDPTSLSYISYLERYATVQPATQDESLEAVMNMPVVPGDRIDTAREARMEVQLADGSTVWLDEYTSLSFDAVAFSRDNQADRTVLYLAEGDVVVEIPQTALAEEPMRLDAPSSTVYLHRPGLFRVETLRNGSLRVETWDGLAEASTPSGGVLVRAGSASEMSGGQVVRAEAQLTTQDDFALWVAQRRDLRSNAASDHMSARYARQASSLDAYGNWVYVDSYNSWAWQPAVSVGWQPYSAGRWYWTPVGWSWISYEPWGWMPYHYGSWWFDAQFGWVWSWDSYWGPAWVDWAWWPGYVGWCPRGYYDYWWRDNCGNCWGGGGGGGGHHDAGDTRPRSRSVLPPPERGGTPARRVGDPPTPSPNSRFALDLRGEARMADVPADGWNVVRSSDFASPHLPRLLGDTERTFREAPVRGVVTSGPLVTPAPTDRGTSGLLEGHFREASRGDLPDLTPVLRRDASVSPDRITRLVRPTTSAGLLDSAPRPATSTTPAIPTLRGGMGRNESSPARTVDRHDSPNLYRPTLRGGGSFSTPDQGTRSLLGGSQPTTGRHPVDVGRSPAERTPINPVGSRGGGAIDLRHTPANPSPTGSSTPYTDRRPVTIVPERSYPSTGASRPTIVPRYTPTNPGSSLTPSPSGSYRILPPSSPSVTPSGGRSPVGVPHSYTPRSPSTSVPRSYTTTRPSAPSVRRPSAPSSRTAPAPRTSSSSSGAHSSVRRKQ